jgi:hypothetical protein
VTPLARAREVAGQARGKLAEGIHPKDARKATKGATFAECAGPPSPSQAGQGTRRLASWAIGKLSKT